MLPAWATVPVAIAGAAVTGVIAGLLTTRLRIEYEREERLRERMLDAADDFVTGVQQAHRGLWETLAAEEQGSTVAERLPAASTLTALSGQISEIVPLLVQKRYFWTTTAAGRLRRVRFGRSWGPAAECVRGGYPGPPMAAVGSRIDGNVGARGESH